MHKICSDVFVMHIYSVFLKSFFFCRGGDKEADKRRKIRCLHIHSRVEGGNGMLIVLTVGGGKEMLTLSLHLNMH